MKFDLKLKDMKKTEGIFKTPYGEHDDTKYEYIFTSGHKLCLYQLFGKRPWAFCFDTPDSKDSGERYHFGSVQEALDEVEKFFENDEVRPKLIKGFVF